MPISSPLRSLGYSSDVLDIKNKTVIRKIHTEYLSVDSPMELIEEGLFKLTLSEPMRDGSPISCVLPVYEGQEELSSAEEGICKYESDSLLMKLTNILTLDDLVWALHHGAIEATYVLSSPLRERWDGDEPLLDGYTNIKVNSSVKPKKFFMVYL